jgi:hypothetical protein
MNTRLLIAATLAFLLTAMVSSRVSLEQNPSKDVAKTNESSRKINLNQNKVSKTALTETDRQRAAISRLRNMTLEEVKKELSSPAPARSLSFADTIFRNLSMERWATEEPSTFLPWALMEPNYTGSSFTRIMKESPDLITEFLTQNQAVPSSWKLFDLLVGKDSDHAIAELTKLVNAPDYDQSKLKFALATLISQRPSEMETLMRSSNAGAGSPLAEAVFRHKLRDNFEDTLKELLTRPDGYQLAFNNQTLNHNHIPSDKLKESLKDLPDSWRRRLAKAPHFLYSGLPDDLNKLQIDWESLGFSPSQANDLRSDFLQREAHTNPEAAFEVISEYEFTAEEKRELIQKSLQARKTDEEWALIREKLTAPEDLSLFDELKLETPSITSTQISNLDDLIAAIESNQAPDLSAMNRWQEEDLADFYARFETASPETKTKLAEIATQQATFSSPLILGEALEHLSNQPEIINDKIRQSESGDLGLSQIVSKHAVDLLFVDPKSAVAWLDRIPPGQIREEATSNIARNWIGYDPKATNEWLRTQPAELREKLAQEIPEIQTQ